MTIGGLTWDSTGQRYYQTGIDAVILYPWDPTINPDGTTTNPKGWYGKPVVWNGVTAINENPSGAESNKIYADNIEYLNLFSKEEFGCTIECYQTPDNFDPCDGISRIFSSTWYGLRIHGQARKSFGLAYRVLKGSDTVEAGGKVAGSTYGSGYVWHFVYGCKAAPSSQDHSTVNDSPEAQTFSYEITTTPISDENILPSINGKKYSTSHVWLDLSKTLVTKAQTKLETYVGNANNIMPTPAIVYGFKS